MSGSTVKVTLTILVVIVGAGVTLLAGLGVIGHGDYLHYLVTRGDVFDLWAVLHILSLIFSVAGIAGIWVSVWRKRLGLAAAFLLLPFPVPFVLEANRCDVLPLCELTYWARLPPEMFEWRVRYRDVDRNTAQNIASGALYDAKLPYHAWDPKRVGGEWRVETRNDDMELGPYEVIVEAKTGKTRVVRP